MKFNSKSTKYLIRAIVFMAWVIPAFSQSKIEKLTTGEGPKDLPGSRTEDFLKIHSLGLALGNTWLHGDFSKYGDNGLGWDLYYNYSASHIFDLLVNFHYNHHSNSKGGSETLRGIVPSAKVKVYQFDSFTPYGLLGLGFYGPTVKNPDYSSNFRVVLGVTLGLGLDLRLNRNWMVGAIFQVHDPFSVPENHGPKLDGSYNKLLLLGFYSF
jgi:opacity protein-like surface antigen